MDLPPLSPSYFLPSFCPTDPGGVVSSSSNLSVEDSSSLWGSRLLSKGEKLWQFACNIGVVGVEADEVYIRKMVEMELRDKSVFGEMVTRNLNQ